MKPLVTITRQYASGGSEIARLVAERLPGWTLIDNEFVEQVAIAEAGCESVAVDLVKDVSRKLRAIYCPAVCASLDLTENR